MFYMNNLASLLSWIGGIVGYMKRVFYVNEEGILFINAVLHNLCYALVLALQ